MQNWGQKTRWGIKFRNGLRWHVKKILQKFPSSTRRSILKNLFPGFLKEIYFYGIGFFKKIFPTLTCKNLWNIVIIEKIYSMGKMIFLCLPMFFFSFSRFFFSFSRFFPLSQALLFTFFSCKSLSSIQWFYFPLGYQLSLSDQTKPPLELWSKYHQIKWVSTIWETSHVIADFWLVALGTTILYSSHQNLV
jgi:hypothetical protein